MSGEVQYGVANEFDAKRVVLESTRYSLDAGFDEVPSRMIATAVSELARNILKYASSGEIRLRMVEGPRGKGIEVVALDRGPGIADVDAAMGDNWSSSGTLGLGLPGVKRMMDEFSLASEPGQGTQVRFVKWR